jgi:hypothetical protein
MRGEKAQKGPRQQDPFGAPLRPAGPEEVGEGEGQGVEGQVEAKLLPLSQDPHGVHGVEGLRHARQAQEEPHPEVAAELRPPQGGLQVQPGLIGGLLGLVGEAEEVPAEAEGQGAQGEEEGVGQGKGQGEGQDLPNQKPRQEGEKPPHQVAGAEEGGPLLWGRGLGHHLPEGEARDPGEEGVQEEAQEEACQEERGVLPEEEGGEGHEDHPGKPQGGHPTVK